MKEIDSVLDGALNVQKVAHLLEEHYPRVMVQTGIEHTVALIFGRLAHAAPIEALCKFAKLVGVKLLFYYS